MVASFGQRAIICENTLIFIERHSNVMLLCVDNMGMTMSGLYGQCEGNMGTSKYGYFHYLVCPYYPTWYAHITLIGPNNIICPYYHSTQINLHFATGGGGGGAYGITKS